MSIKPVKGLRSYYPTDKGPVDTYQLGHSSRVEYLTAEIAIDHINKGSDTTEEWRKWARERGEPSDEPGLILSSRLGGSGTDKTNLFPKSPLIGSIWKEHEQAAYEEASEMRKWKKIKISVRLEYPSDDSTRPSSLEYQYDLPSGTVLYGKVNNELATEEVEEVEEEEEEEEELENTEKEVSASEIEESEPEPAASSPEPEPEPIKRRQRVVEESEPTSVIRVRPAPPTETEEPSTEKRRRPAAEEQSQVIDVRSPVIEVRSPIVNVRPPVVEQRPPVVEQRPPVVVQERPPPPPPKPKEPSYSPPPRAYESPRVSPALQDNYQKKEPQSPPKKRKPTKEEITNQETGVITKSDLIDLIPVLGSCKLAVETVQAAYNGNGKLALRKAVQCGISLVADFYLGRAIARHGQILAQAVTEQTVIRFVTKAENQIIIVSAFKAGNQLLNTVARALS